MTDEEGFDDFDFMTKCAKQVREAILSHEEYHEWFNDMCEVMAAENPAPPEGTFEFLSDLIQSDSTLYHNFRGIVLNPDCPENETTLYSLVFTTEEITVHEDEPDAPDQILMSDDEDAAPEAVNETLTAEDLEDQQSQQVKKLIQFLAVSEDAALLILKHFSWNPERAMQEFSDNREKVLETLGIPEDRVNGELGLRAVQKDFECEICYLDATEGYECTKGHLFCTGCWRDHIKIHVSGACDTITCMAEDCPCEVMHRDIEKICGKEVADTYHRFLMEANVVHSRQLVNCPGKGCDRVLTLDSVGLCGVAECVCGARICWKCHEEAHAPCTCAQVRRWEECRHENWQLQRQQALWEKKEQMVLEYRRQHLDEVTKEQQAELAEVAAAFEQKEAKLKAIIQSLEVKAKTASSPEEAGPIERALDSRRRDLKMMMQDDERELDKIRGEQQAYQQALQNGRYAAFFLRAQRESEEMRMLAKQGRTTEEWIELSTRPCPKCKTRIEKNGGCNYVQCSRCGFAFCWVCGDDWKTHGDHFVCNKFDGKAASVSADVDIDEAEIDLTDKSYHPPPMTFQAKEKFLRFAHYNRRFMAHKDAQKREQVGRGKNEPAMIECFSRVTTKEKSKAAVLRAYRAIDVARSVLIWSYPFAYLMEPDSTRLHFFEIRQGPVELCIEKVASLVERYQWEPLDDFERFVGNLEKYTHMLLELADGSGSLEEFQ